MIHTGTVEVLKLIAQDHSAVQEGGRSEATKFDVRGVKGGDLEGVQRLQAHPQDGPVLQIYGEINIGGR